jgi:hypothetical protein
MVSFHAVTQKNECQQSVDRVSISLGGEFEILEGQCYGFYP